MCSKMKGGCHQGKALGLTMFTDLWSTQNRGLPPGVPKLGCLLHPGPSQRLLTTLTCTYTTKPVPGAAS